MNQEQRASVNIARLIGADFGKLSSGLDGLEAIAAEYTAQAQKARDAVAAMPDISTEGEAPSVEELQEMIAESKREEALAAEREAARQREAEQEAEHKKKREEERKRRESLGRIRAQEAERQRRREAINGAWNPTRKFTPFVPQESTKAEPENDDYEVEF
ncbi:hypothetical protein ABRP93_11415 [Corynebacterium sp. KPL2850]|uniref:hypothetical protein n=1 Tax=Corynebacterium sp. KPL2850 TaxID=3158318 RepID=UPI0032EE2EE0